MYASWPLMCETVFTTSPSVLQMFSSALLSWVPKLSVSTCFWVDCTEVAIAEAWIHWLLLQESAVLVLPALSEKVDNKTITKVKNVFAVIRAFIILNFFFDVCTRLGAFCVVLTAPSIVNRFVPNKSYSYLFYFFTVAVCLMMQRYGSFIQPPNTYWPTAPTVWRTAITLDEWLPYSFKPTDTSIGTTSYSLTLI